VRTYGRECGKGSRRGNRPYDESRSSKGPVFYASLPRDTEPSRDMDERRRSQHRWSPFCGSPCGDCSRRGKEADLLWTDFLGILFSSNCSRRDRRRTDLRSRFRWSATRLASPISVGYTSGAAISFSECGGRVWAAFVGMSPMWHRCAEAVEFRENTLSRVFNEQELQHALALAHGDLEKASAQLWSVKEAVVKASDALSTLWIRCKSMSIHLQRGTTVIPFRGLIREICGAFPNRCRPVLMVRSFPQAKMWLSIAVLNRHIDGRSRMSNLTCKCVTAVGRSVGGRT